MQLQGISRRWFAIQTRVGSERLSAEVLRNKGYEEFLPLCPQPRVGQRETGKLSPMFPGYLFCRFGPEVLGPIVTTPGVLRILGVGNQLAPVEDVEIESIRKVAESGLPPQPCPFVETGRQVRITKGPLAGARGILVDAGISRRLVVSVSLLQRSIEVTVDAGWIELDGAAN